MKKISFLAVFVLMFSYSAHAEVGATRVGISAPVMILESEAFWGGNIDVLHEVSPGLEIGGETGFHIYSTNGLSMWNIPVMPTLLYTFDTGMPTFAPFLGVGLGIGITHASLNFGGFSATGTEVNFQGLAHIGAKFGAARSFFTDMKLGLLDDSFIFLPSIGWFF